MTPRLLTYAEQRVDPRARTEYLVRVAVRREIASSIGANFWVFEHTEERGRFVEFTEADSESAIRAVNEEGRGEHESLALWRELRGE